jgi:hypothetical protein
VLLPTLKLYRSKKEENKQRKNKNNGNAQTSSASNFVLSRRKTIDIEFNF